MKSDRAATIVLDGKTYTEKTLSEREARKIPYIISASARADESTFYGFNSEASMKEWLGKQHLLDEYDRGERFISQANRKLTRTEEAEISRIQSAAVDEATERLNSVMFKEGIKFGETEKLRKLLTDYDPLRGPIIHSAILWEHSHQGGRAIVLPGGWAFRDLGWLNFNKITSSALVVTGWLSLYVDTRFRGGRLIIWGIPFTGYAPNFDGWPLWFNDDASSAIVV